MTVDEPLSRGMFDDVWHKYVPLKVSPFAWRLLRNRLPTKDNLVSRRVLQHDDDKCIRGCNAEETACHLFLSCAIFGHVWLFVLQWLGISFVATDRVHGHFHQFSHIAGLPWFTHSFMTLLWLASVWKIWKERNNWVFNQKALDLHQITDTIKHVSYQWLKASMNTFAFNYTDWLRQPLSCMSVMLWLVLFLLFSRCLLCSGISNLTL